MKKKILNTIAVGLLAMFSIPAMAQTDTSIKPGRTKIFMDPKITNYDSKVLIDTSNNIVDSLLDAKKESRNKTYQNNTQPPGKSTKPVKPKKAPADSARNVKP